MALQNQFNLSVELTNLLPFRSLISTASRGLIHLVRDLRKSGSDIVAEEDLAEIFGRNRIESRFASTFRTAVKKSAIHRLSEIAEIVLEAGAGPTVKRSLNEQAYSSTVIQLSLLTWAHELDSLARALAKALERRVQGSEGYRDILDQETLKGTLRACREQTSGFLWELMFVAVETRLKDIEYLNRPYESRPIPFYILQALLDAFTAVQYFPDERLIRIETWQGVVTIVVWAHHLLGLTVRVHAQGNSICFGRGSEQVSIDCELRATETDTTCIALLDAAQEVHFSLSPNPAEEPTLEPACRHPALGYGNRIFSFDVEDHVVVRELAHRVVASCLMVVKEGLEQRQAAGTCDSGGLLIPSRRRIINTGSLLFEDLDCSPTHLDRLLQEPCLLRCSWEPHEIPEIVEAYLKSHHKSMRLSAKAIPVKKTFRRLCYILLAFANVLDIDACSGLPLDLYPGLQINREQIQLPTTSESFDVLSRLLLGNQYEEEKVRKAALLSSWGWSIFLSSVNSRDPSQLLSEISIRHGVPCRYGERKEWILDSFSKQTSQYGVGRGSSGSSRYTIVAQAGDTVTLRSLSKARKSRYFIDVSGSAFEVMKQFECEAEKRYEYDEWIGARVGFRGMQDMWWEASRLPGCSHPAELGVEAVVPDETYCFSGLMIERMNKRTDLDECLASENGWVHVGLVAGNPSARWLLLGGLLSWLTYGSRHGTVFLRGGDCCLACAMDVARSGRNGRTVAVVL